MEVIVGLLSVLLLVAVNGFFVAGEFALVGARRTRITQLATEGHKSAQIANRAIEHLDSYIAATQLGITLASLGLGWIGEPAVAGLTDPLFEAILPEKWISAVGHTLSVGIAFSIVTALHIIFGELAPKSIALQRPEATALIVARPTSWFLGIFRPIIKMMNFIGNGVVRLLGFEPAGSHAQVHSSEELEMLIASSREAGLLQESEERLLRRVFDFSDIQVQEVMQPRVDVDAISHDITLSELLKITKAQHHSRYPIYEEAVDNIVGVLHLKDFLEMLIDQPALLTDPNQPFDVKAVAREPLFIPATLSLDRLLDQMQRTQNHLVIVVDEYGGVAGVATMEDVFEELVGEVQDEFDTELASSAAINGESVVDGLTNLNEIVERFGELPEESQSLTLGGYISERLGRIPRVADTIQYGNYDVRVQDMDGRRVGKVVFVQRQTVPPDNPDGERPSEQ